jgi:hypothetical protein
LDYTKASRDVCTLSADMNTDRIFSLVKDLMSVLVPAPYIDDIYSVQRCIGLKPCDELLQGKSPSDGFNKADDRAQDTTAGR